MKKVPRIKGVSGICERSRGKQEDPPLLRNSLASARRINFPSVPSTFARHWGMHVMTHVQERPLNFYRLGH
jgi:hypothetical protein